MNDDSATGKAARDPAAHSITPEKLLDAYTLLSSIDDALCDLKVSSDSEGAKREQMRGNVQKACMCAHQMARYLAKGAALDDALREALRFEAWRLNDSASASDPKPMNVHQFNLWNDLAESNEGYESQCQKWDWNENIRWLMGAELSRAYHDKRGAANPTRDDCEMFLCMTLGNRDGVCVPDDVRARYVLESHWRENARVIQLWLDMRNRMSATLDEFYDRYMTERPQSTTFMPWSTP